MMIEAELKRSKNYQSYGMKLVKTLPDDTSDEERKIETEKLFGEIRKELKEQMEIG